MRPSKGNRELSTESLNLVALEKSRLKEGVDATLGGLSNQRILEQRFVGERREEYARNAESSGVISHPHQASREEPQCRYSELDTSLVGLPQEFFRRHAR